MIRPEGTPNENDRTRVQSSKPELTHVFWDFNFFWLPKIGTITLRSAAYRLDDNSMETGEKRRRSKKWTALSIAIEKPHRIKDFDPFRNQ